MTIENRISCEQAEAWIEEKARGTLGRDEATRLGHHAAACPACAERMEDAVAVRALFREVGRPVCPESVVRRVQVAVDAGERGRAGASPATQAARLAAGFRDRVHPFRALAWGTAAAAVAALALLLLWSQPGRDVERRAATETRGAASGSASGAEIERAAQETRLAFAILAGAINRTARVVGDEVGTQLGSPVLEGVELGLGAIGIQRAPRSHRGAGAEPGTERPGQRRAGRDEHTGDPQAMDRERNWS
jgi:hypothetical protein